MAWKENSKINYQNFICLSLGRPRRKALILALNHLPDVCLLEVFANLSVYDLFVLKRVCRRWNWLIQSAIARHRSLTIAVGGFELINESVFGLGNAKPKERCAWINLHPTHLTIDTFQCLVRAFPNVRSLRFSINRKSQNLPCNAVKKLIFVLRCYAPQLTSLKLYLNFPSEFFEPLRDLIQRQLIESVNSLRSLRHLSLELRNPYVTLFSASATQLLIANTLTHLETFQFDSPDDRYLSQLFGGLATCNAMQHVRIGNVHFANQLFDQSHHQTNALINQRINQLRVQLTRDRLTSVSAVQLPNLSCLHLSIVENLSLFQVCQALRHLPSLTYLHLKIDFKHVHLDHHHHPPRAASSKCELSQVKTLSLNILNNSSHLDLVSTRLVECFPRLEVVQLRLHLFECHTCKLKLLEFFSFESRELCIWKMCQVFRRSSPRFRSVEVKFPSVMIGNGLVHRTWTKSMLS